MHGLYNISSFSTTDPAGMGNIRVMFAQTGKVLQDQSYYPFGMTMGSSLTFQVEDQLPDNKYKYNGNPDGDRGQDDFGLNWYVYGARMYDPTIGRWNGIDAHAENYFSLSSYNYGLNNPIRMIDPDGMDARLYDIDEWNAFSMDEYGNITLYGSSSGQGNDKTKGKTSKKGNDKKDDNSENNPNQGDPIKDHLLDVAAGNAPGNMFGSQVIGASYGNNGGGASSGVAANGGGYEAVLKPYEPNWADEWYDRSKENIISNITYGLIDGLWVTAQSFILGPDARHLNGTVVVGDDRIDAFVNTAESVLVTAQIKPLHTAKNGWHFYNLGYHHIGKNAAKSAGYEAGNYLHLNISGKHLIFGQNFLKNMKYFKHLK